jgi:transposase
MGETPELLETPGRSVVGPYVGIDVAKEWLDLAVRPHGAPGQAPWRSANTETEMPALITRLRAVAPELIVVEATGG